MHGAHFSYFAVMTSVITGRSLLSRLHAASKSFALSAGMISSHTPFTTVHHSGRVGAEIPAPMKGTTFRKRVCCSRRWSASGG